MALGCYEVIQHHEIGNGLATLLPFLAVLSHMLTVTTLTRLKPLAFCVEYKTTTVNSSTLIGTCPERLSCSQVHLPVSDWDIKSDQMLDAVYSVCGSSSAAAIKRAKEVRHDDTGPELCAT